MSFSESYAHYSAKYIFRDWLVDKWRFNKKLGYRNTFFIFDWKIDLSDTDCGIRVEYPILSKIINTSNDLGTKDILGLKQTWSKYPDLEKAKENGLFVEAIIDIVICEDHRPKYGIEIVYKHPCTERKIRFLKSLTGYDIRFPVYEVSATWILDQIYGKVPNKVPLTPINTD